MASDEVKPDRAVTRRSLALALGMVLLWTVGCCFLAVYVSVHPQQLFMVLGFGAILTVLLLRFPVLFLVALGVCWVGTCVGMRFFSGASPGDYPRLYMGMLRGLPVLLGLAGLAAYLWRRPLRRGELTVVFAAVVIAIPWCICIKAVLESSMGSLFELHLKSEPLLYNWAKELPWWGPTVATGPGQEPSPAAIDAANGFQHGNGGDVPWRFWWRPMLYWSGTCIFYQMMLMGLLLLFRKAWVERERLPFIWAMPVLTLINHQEGSAPTRRPWLWFGLGLAICLPGVIQVAPAGQGAGTALGVPPWVGVEGIRGGLDLSHLNLLPGTPIYLFWGPLLLAILLLLPVDILMTVALTHILVGILVPGVMRSLGLHVGLTNLEAFTKWGLRFGGGLGILVWSVWFNRRTIWGYLRSLWGGRPVEADADDELPRPLVAAIALAGLIGFVLLGCYATSTTQMLFLTAFTLIYAFSQTRQRAEGHLVTYENNITSHQMTSIQRDFLHDHRNLPVPTTTGHSWAGHWIAWAFAGQLKSFGPHNMLLEVFKIAHEVRVHARTIAKVIAATMLLVAVLTPLLYVQLMYTYGFDNSFQERLTHSGSFTQWSERAASYSIHSRSQVWYLPLDNFYDRYRNIFNTAYGVIIVGILFYLRREFPRFPFSPIGVVWAADYYHRAAVPFAAQWTWFSFLMIWIIKGLIFRWLGVRSFREKVQPAVIMVMCGIIFGMMVYISRYISLGYGCLK